MVSRAPPVAMESHRLSPPVPRPKKEAKEERRERKEGAARSKSKRSAKGQRLPSEAEREAEPNNMAGMTQAELAEASGVNIRQIQRVELGEAEAGNLTAKKLISVADALGVNARSLI